MLIKASEQPAVLQHGEEADWLLRVLPAGLSVAGHSSGACPPEQSEVRACQNNADAHVKKSRKGSRPIDLVRVGLERALVHGLRLVIVAKHCVQQHPIVVEHIHLLGIHFQSLQIHLLSLPVLAF